MNTILEQERAARQRPPQSILRSALQLRADALLLLVVLAGLPPFLVVLDRWLEVSQVNSILFETWQHIPFLADTVYPSYTLIVFTCFLLLAGLVCLYPGSLFTPFTAAQAVQITASPVRPGQRLAARVLETLAAVAALGIFLNSLFTKTWPGAVLLLAILGYVAGRVLAEFPLPNILSAPFKIPVWSWLYLAFLAAETVFLDFAAGHSPLTWGMGILVAALGYLLFQVRRQFSPALWLVPLALALWTILIGSWQFAVVGDEYSFFTFGREIAYEHGLANVAQDIFKADGVYGSHPYFSSMIQAASMLVFGPNNFGWRFSSLLLSALSIPFYFFFFKRFVSSPIAGGAAALLAVSHYVMSFGKIGYNNLQALFAGGLVLWLAGEAVFTRRSIAYTGLGLAVGLCLYVYPAALYLLPLPVVMMLFFDPPIRRDAVGRWLLAFAAFCLLFFPLLFQPEFFESKVMGTLFYNPDVIDTIGLGTHFARNTLYAFFSYLLIPNETHFVVSGFVDPLTAAFLPVGLVWAVRSSFSNRKAACILVAFGLLLFLTGATHDRPYPTATRMFLLLPWFFLFASLGLAWVGAQLARAGYSKSQLLVLAAVTLTVILGLNLYNAYILSRVRMPGLVSLETLVIRLMQHAESSPVTEGSEVRTYTFITEPDWGIDGIRIQRDVYGAPASQDQLDRIPVEGPALPPELTSRFSDENALFIIQPWMEPSLKHEVETALLQAGLEACFIQVDPQADPKFITWMHPHWMELCPQGGHW